MTPMPLYPLPPQAGTRAGPFDMPALRQARLLARADRPLPHRHAFLPVLIGGATTRTGAATLN